MKQRYPCEEILARETVFAASFGPSCCCGGPDDKFWELLFAFPMPYFQSYGLAYCSRDLWGGWPWWHDWGTPYDLDFRPILWRFPDAYSASSVLTDPQAIPALLVGYGVLVWMDVGRIRARQSAHFWFICGVIVLSTLSFVLAAAETERQANYWETKTRATELSSKASNRTSRTWGDSPAQVTLWRPYRDYVLKWMESTQKGPLSIFDSKRATYMHLTPPYTRHFRWIWEPINVEPYISNDLY
ncbi:hypothetical protein QBC47DRAFT_391712 [Echria macrotheca]|uniref:Uncharacterized protein n=1 Tax=Echria macrotheca TaxID=438768 RepID=A0AAJ0B8K6_9PEZI|nr:hypothetical protein QBC47DRAFT_391712 [Echria macrotheca]